MKTNLEVFFDEDMNDTEINDIIKKLERCTCNEKLFEVIDEHGILTTSGIMVQIYLFPKNKRIINHGYIEIDFGDEK